MENRNPPTIIVTPRISEATLGIGVFGLGAGGPCSRSFALPWESQQRLRSLVLS